LIRALLDRIRLTPVKGNSKVDPKGALAGIMALASESRKPAASGGELSEASKVGCGGPQPPIPNIKALAPQGQPQIAPATSGLSALVATRRYVPPLTTALPPKVDMCTSRPNVL